MLGLDDREIPSHHHDAHSVITCPMQRLALTVRHQTISRLTYDEIIIGRCLAPYLRHACDNAGSIVRDCSEASNISSKIGDWRTSIKDYMVYMVLSCELWDQLTSHSLEFRVAFAMKGAEVHISRTKRRDRTHGG